MSLLPVATAPQVRRYAKAMVRAHPRRLGAALALYALAAAAGLEVVMDKCMKIEHRNLA